MSIRIPDARLPGEWRPTGSHEGREGEIVRSYTNDKFDLSMTREISSYDGSGKFYFEVRPSKGLEPRLTLPLYEECPYVEMTLYMRSMEWLYDEYIERHY